MTSLIRSIAVFAGLLSFSATPGIADTVELTGGGHLSGSVKQVEGGKTPYIVVAVDSELRVALPQNRVRRVVTPADLTEYRRRVAIAGDDAELNYLLARWCVGNHLQLQSRYHYQRAIEIDPEHGYARAALSYVKDGKEWVKHSDLQRSRGMISFNGKWQLPEAVAIQVANETADVAAKKWVRDLKRLVKTALGGGGAGADAIATIAAIEDPAAATAIALELAESRSGKSVQPRAMREMWVKLLGRMQNMVAVSTLVRAGVEEPDDIVREAAMDQLQLYGASSAIATYLPMLKSEKNRDVKRAALALSYFPPDPELAMTLTEALVTEHKFVSAPSAGVGASFGNDGSSSFGTPQATVRVDVVENRGVHHLIRMIEPTVDYGFNESKWLHHFGSQRAAYEGDLRRDR